jgi:ATP-binding cassette subfamily F protein uup
LFDKRLAQEEAWIRQGIKARRSRNEGRVKALKRLREQRRARQAAPGQVRLRIQEGARSGQLVTGVEGLGFAYDDRPIVKDFSTTIMRGDRVGIIGPNGAGKTTLLRLLLGQLEPQTGSVKTGTNLQIAYFDQLREQLDVSQTVQHNVSDGSDTLDIGGRRQHVIGYLQDFLFSPERARTEVRFLSGGERNRVLLAKLFAKAANTVVLDEPTNDLDGETLELLEQRLIEFSGTVLLVSHDREFLNNVVTSTIVFEQGNVKEYVGGYDDWLRQRPTSGVEAPKSSATKARSMNAEASVSTDSPRRLSFQEKKELEALPRLIESLETQIQKLHDAMADPEYYQRPGDQIADDHSHLKDLVSQLEVAYERWEELDR